MKHYLVGGAVRDLLLGRMPKEWDYAFEGNTESFIQANPGACKAGRSVSVVLIRGMEHMPLMACWQSGAGAYMSSHGRSCGKSNGCLDGACA